jgi:hypothetical protein
MQDLLAGRWRRPSDFLCASPLANDEDDALPVRSLQFAIADKRGGVPKLPLRTVFYALNGVALFVLLSLCISMHNTISRLETQAVGSV